MPFGPAPKKGVAGPGRGTGGVRRHHKTAIMEASGPTAA
ncbi:MAG: hypothetical protein K0R61_3038, partial [Microvirga sp.]|nr:hypothetical protein [Microvirga sp.]